MKIELISRRKYTQRICFHETATQRGQRDSLCHKVLRRWNATFLAHDFYPRFKRRTVVASN